MKVTTEDLSQTIKEANKLAEELRMKLQHSKGIMKQDPKTAIRGYCCPVCGGPVHSSGFSGNPFCWGKCYRYFKYEDLLKGVGSDPETAKEK